jgi:glycosyltransferase involved in cell wall biosynthesis
MLRIICTVTNDLTYDQRMIRICASLARVGYEVELVGRRRSFSRPLKEAPFRQKRLRCFFNKGKLFYLEYNLRLFFFLLSHPFDIVCSVDLDTILPGYLISKLRGKACVFDAHEYFTETPEVERRPAVKKIWEWVAQFTIPRLKHCYTVCESLAEVFEKRYGTPFEVIRNVPFRRTEPVEKIGNERPVILYQGVLNEARGLEQAIEAMRDIENAELWLAGGGDLSDRLRKLAEELNTGDRVKFLGRLSPEELQVTTLRADIGLNLLENRSLSYYYSLANKAFDYIQSGIPSIHMDFPEYRRINEEIEVFHLITDPAPDTIAAAVRKLLNDKEYAEKLQKNCRIAAELFNWEKEESRLVEIYKGIVEMGE